MVFGCMMLAVSFLIVILSTTKLGLDVTGNQKNKLCDMNYNQTLNGSLLCEHESRPLTTLAIDVTSFVTNVLVILC